MNSIKTKFSAIWNILLRFLDSSNFKKYAFISLLVIPVEVICVLFRHELPLPGTRTLGQDLLNAIKHSASIFIFGEAVSFQ